MRTDRNMRRVEALEAKQSKAPALSDPWDAILEVLSTPALYELRELAAQATDGTMDVTGEQRMLAILETGAPDPETFLRWKAALK